MKPLSAFGSTILVGIAIATSGCYATKSQASDTSAEQVGDSVPDVRSEGDFDKFFLDIRRAFASVPTTQQEDKSPAD